MLIACVLLVAVVGTLVWLNRCAVAAQRDLRARLRAGHGATMVLGPDHVMRTFSAAPQLEGLDFTGNAEVDKMFARARTGGGFCPLTFRSGDALVRHVFYVEFRDGALRGVGAAQ